MTSTKVCHWDFTWDNPNALPVKAQQEGDTASGEHYMGDMCKRTLSKHTCESQPVVLV